MTQVVFGAYNFVGMAEEFEIGEWDRQIAYTSMFGVLGASALDGGRTVRSVQVPLFMWGSIASASAWWSTVAAIEALIGSIGLLVDNGPSSKSFNNTQFLSIVPDKEFPPVPTAPDGGWIGKVMLTFLQLSP